MAHFSLSNELNEKIENWCRKRNIGQETVKALFWLSFFFGRFTACRSWRWWQETRTLLSQSVVSLLALPQTHHVKMTRFRIYWAVIMFACFTVGLGPCGSGDWPCSCTDKAVCLFTSVPSERLLLCVTDGLGLIMFLLVFTYSVCSSESTAECSSLISK